MDRLILTVFVLGLLSLSLIGCGWSHTYTPHVVIRDYSTLTPGDRVAVVLIGPSSQLDGAWALKANVIRIEKDEMVLVSPDYGRIVLGFKYIAALEKIYPPVIVR